MSTKHSKSLPDDHEHRPHDHDDHHGHVSGPHQHHDHGHRLADNTSEKRLRIATVVLLAFTVVEAGGGLWANSIALHCWRKPHIWVQTVARFYLPSWRFE